MKHNALMSLAEIRDYLKERIETPQHLADYNVLVGNFNTVAQSLGFSISFGLWAIPIEESDFEYPTAESRFIKELEKRSMSTWSDEELARYSKLTGQK